VINSQTDQSVNTTYFTYTPNTTLIAYPNGNKELDQFQNNALVAKTEAYQTAQGETWTYSYDSATLGITRVATPVPGEVTNNTWYSSGFLHTTTDPLSHQT